MIGQDQDPNNDREKQNDEEGDEEHVEGRVLTGNRLKIPVKELKLGVDDDASTLATQVTSIKLVYIMNIQEEIKGTINDARNDGKNSSEMKTRNLLRELDLQKNLSP